MNLLEEFASELNLMSCLDECPEIHTHEDHSEFTSVDGEEDDYGRIKYYSKDNELLALKTDYGGDNYEAIFTEKGKELLKSQFLQIVKSKINALSTLK